jgi:SAM-dependent methyltransferase
MIVTWSYGGTSLIKAFVAMGSRMTDNEGFQESIDALLGKIRSEVNSRNSQQENILQRPITVQLQTPCDTPSPKSTQAMLETAPESQPLECKEGYYHISDFLKYHDQDFVLNAYRGILQREADPAGLHAHLEELRTGRVSKVELLGRFRYSPEGRMKGTRVRGLGLRFIAQAIFKIPVLGYVGRWVNAIIMLPVIVGNFQKLDFYSHTQFAHLDIQDHRLNQLIATKSEHVEVQQLTEDVRHLRESKADQADVRAILPQIAQVSKDVKDQRRLSLEQERALRAFLEEARKPTAGTLTSELQKEISDEEDHLLDGFYVAFQDAFRGSREEIEEKLRGYLPCLGPAGLDGATHAVLDLGCGRGEWLEMLREQGFRGHGVDTNRVALAMCRERGLEVTEADAVAFLKVQKSDSFEAVTGFHLIEHLAFKTWISLFDETLRVLNPRGIFIFETPNPLSLAVALGGFYRDPTHRFPVHPDTLKLIAESRGFVNVTAYFMDRALGGRKLLNAQDVRFDDLAAYQKVSEDFVLMGYKP